MELINFSKKIQISPNHIQVVRLKMISLRTMNKNKKSEKKRKPKILWTKQTSFLVAYPSAHGQV
jgi:hypothetical protein